MNSQPVFALVGVIAVVTWWKAWSHFDICPGMAFLNCVCVATLLLLAYWTFVVIGALVMSVFR